MLKFPAKWRITPPVDSKFKTATIPSDARDEFFGIAKAIVANAPDQKQAFEEFKKSFALARGVRYGPSSSRDYAEYDLGEALTEASSNAPKFLEAFHDGWLAVSILWPQLTEVDVELLNAIASKYSIGYVVDPPVLGLREDVDVIPVAQTSLLEAADQQFRESIERSEQLLREGRGREAVQNSLWLLESISTAFQDVGAHGHYFNKIIQSLRQSHPGTTFDRVLHWMEELHGLLSSPKAGGIRHGLHLKADAIEPYEAHLFCNLIRAYTNYLLAEYERRAART